MNRLLPNLALAAVLFCAGAIHAAERDVPWLADVQQPPAMLPTVALAPLWPADAAPKSVADWQPRRTELRRQWLELLGPMPDRPASTTVTVLRTDRLPDVTRELIEYECEPGLRVQAYLLRPNAPATGRSRAGIVALHPTTKETIEPIAGVTGEELRHTGLKLAQRGFVVLCPRCFLWQDAADYTAAVANFQARHPQTLGMHKMLYDAQRAVDLLAAQPDVDPARLGACGHSLGAKETLYLAAFDDRMRAAVFSEGGIGIGYSNWEAPWYLGPTVKQPGFAHDHHELLALIAPRPFLILGGEQGPGAVDGDRSWPYLAAALPAYRLFGTPARIGLLNHRQGHTVSPESFARWAEWLEVYLAEARR
jgi:hypothetical protein